MLSGASISFISIPDAFLLSIVGFSVVFIALISLIGVIKAVSTLTADKKTTAD